MELDQQTKKRMLTMLKAMGILFGGIFLYKTITKLFFGLMMAASGISPVTVSAMKVEYSLWQPAIKAAASLRAVKGVDVTTELAGMVQTIYFTPGALSKENDV